MISQGTYVARRLFRSGEWDAALAALAGRTDTEAVQLRAEIAYERYFFTLEDYDTAATLVDAVDPGSAWGRYLRAKLAYSRLLFKNDPKPEDRETAEAGFRTAAADPELRPWCTFFLGVLMDNIVEDRAAAAELYNEALTIARAEGDGFVESVIIRHQSYHAIHERGDRDEGLRLLRRSLHLRAAVGARPQTAAAMVLLAAELPVDDPERAMLAEAAGSVAQELKLAWVSSSIEEL